MHRTPRMEFHIARQARDRYQFDRALYSSKGTVVFADFGAARVFAQRLNTAPPRSEDSSKAVSAGEVNAMALLHELLHIAFGQYREEHSPDALTEALAELERQYGPTTVDEVLQSFVDSFPPRAVYVGQVDRASYLQGETDGVPNREIALEEMLLLGLQTENPAYQRVDDLFNVTPLVEGTSYPQLQSELRAFLRAQPPTDGQLSIIDLLRAPALAAPGDLFAQLRFIQERWGFVGNVDLLRLLSGLDLIKEETKPRFFGPGPTQVLTFGPGADGVDGFDSSADLVEPERFSLDREWMPELVMIAKSTYVWLDQLSKTYQTSIQRLDQIPDVELDRLAQRGFRGLWLIGIWERSRASQTIKQLCGNPEAAASAYSLFDYEIAAEIGGTAAYENLRDRAMARGIRLASDMVPNHMGIDSRWVNEHPDWFVSVPQTPFPSYSFNGPDLGRDGQIGIYLEDHYYSQADAAVVFQRVDRTTGDVRYIYHGNDGTALPWNDTAQLNYLNPEVREAVIQKILDVARQFPIIRFDAAMTLAKKHFQRLWYPQPGTGGDIASRADHALTKAQFDQAMPEEFWREVVDRVAQEVPNTLLLAEAFWMMESYFVRTLGMHRVYNSAFMHMLKNEENGKYRATIKNTLEFDPEILKRFVNFLNNPDEKTAVEQFGKGDKYFGVCLLMSTMPGLPMFGHGQIEGFSEKYGMEYRRAYYDEQPDPYLLERHTREIFPLLHRRELFANVDHFRLYDLIGPEGMAEDVFAYSNGLGDERALVVYHNKFGTARGTLHYSAVYSQRVGDGDERDTRMDTLGGGLNLHAEDDWFVQFRDHITGLEYLHSSQTLHQQGLPITLDAFKYQVFLDFREVRDATGQYRRLAGELNGRGVPSIADALRVMLLEPIHRPFREWANAGIWRWFMDNRATRLDTPPALAPLDEAETRVTHLLAAIKSFTGSTGDEVAVAHRVRLMLDVLLCLPVLHQQLDVPTTTEDDAAVHYFTAQLTDDPARWGTVWGWLGVFALGQINGMPGAAKQSRAWIDEWLLDRLLVSDLRNFGLGEDAVQRSVQLIKLLTRHQRWFTAPTQNGAGEGQMLDRLLQDRDVQQFIDFNHFEGVDYLDKQQWEQLLWWLFVIAVVEPIADPRTVADEVDIDVIHLHAMLQRWQAAAATADYQAERLRTIIQEQGTATKEKEPQIEVHLRRG